VGSLFIPIALERGHKLTVLARTPGKLKVQHENLTVVQGDATKLEDIQKVVQSDTDILISAVGNTKGNPVMMEEMARHLLEIKPKRAAIISSLGMNGSSPTIRCILSCIGGSEVVNDLDACDMLLCGNPGITVIRPDGLCDKSGHGKYKATLKTGMGMGYLPRADVALFLADVIDESKWDGQGVQLYKCS